MNRKIRQLEFWAATVLLMTYIVIYVHHGYLLRKESAREDLPFDLARYLLPNLLTGLIIYTAFASINFWLVPKWWLTGAYARAIAGTIACLGCTAGALAVVALYLPYQIMHLPASESAITLVSRELFTTVISFGLLAVYITLRQIAVHQYRQYGLSQTLASRVIKETGAATLVWLWILNLLWGLEYKPLFGTFGVYYLIVLPFGSVIYFINLYWLIPVFKNSAFNRYWHYSFRLIAILLLLTLLEIIGVKATRRMLPDDPLLLTAWIIPLTAALTLSWLFYHINERKYRKLTSLKAALDAADARLQLLRSQINPHFLFNTLNALYGTAITDGSMRTAEGIQQLSDMMRFMLHENNRDMIPFEREVAYLKNYLSLQQLRLGQAAVEVTSELNNSGHDLFIAPMLLIPLVENAFKHGIGPPDRPSFISLNLKVQGEHIYFQVSNSIHSHTTRDPEEGRSGIGLSNVSQRLQVYHKGRHQFRYGAVDGKFTAELMIDTQPTPATQKLFTN